MTATADPQVLLAELLDPTNRADPYPIYARIRDAGPLVLPESHLVVLSTFDACDDVLRHPDAASDGMKSTLVRQRIAAGEVVRPFGPPSFLFLDPPDHTRLRKLVSKAFVPRVVKALEPEITALVDGLLDDIGGERFDVIADLAYPLPVAVICRLLGVPLEDEPQFSQASAILAQALDPFVTVTGQTPDNVDERLAAARWLRDYLHGLVDERRRAPREDLISAMIAAEEAGDSLTEDEIVSTCDLLLIAGHETTVNLIANAVLALLRDPARWQSVAGNPALVPAVVEETLRYDPPVQLNSRIAAADMTIGDVTVPAGDTMLLLLAAANRDPAAHDRPDVFDPSRGAIRHLGFGKGPHFCLGAPLARLEATVALTALLARFPAARLDGDPVYKPNLTLRGMSTLPVAP